MTSSAFADSFINNQLASCLANGLGSLCGATASSGFGPGLGSAGSSTYSSSSGSTGSRDHSISSVDSLLSDMVMALGADDMDHLMEPCHSCGENSVLGGRCTVCTEVPCDVLDDMSVPPPQLPHPQLVHPHVPLPQVPHPQVPHPQLPPPPLPPLQRPPPQVPPPGPTAVPAGRVRAPPMPIPSGNGRARAAGPATCDQHPGESLKLVCDTCATPICGVCTKGPRRHRGHHFTYLKVAIEASRAANAKYLADATHGAQNIRDRLHHTQKMAESVDAKAAQVAAEVRQASRRMIAAVEARERELLSQVDKIRVLKSKSLLVQTEALQGLLQRFVRLGDALRATLQQGDTVQHIHATDKAAVELAQLRAARASLGRGSAPPAFEDDAIVFVPPERMLLGALSSMGAISSSGYALTTVAVGEGLTRAVRGRPAAFTVMVKNHLNGESVPCPPDTVEAVLVAPDGGLTRADVEDRRDGTFLAVYRPRAEGPHALNVTLRGRHIVGSPFQLVVRAVRSYDAVRKPSLAFGGEGGEDGHFLRPWGICCDRQGRLIVADRSNNRIQVFGPDGTFLFKFGSQGSAPGQFDRPAGVACTQDRIIVADKDNHRIQIFSGNGEFLKAFGSMGSGNGQFNYPWDVDVNSSGQIVVADTRNHRIQLFSPDGVFINKYGWENSASMWKHFDTPRGVCFNSEGYVIVTDFNNHRLVVVEPTFRNARFLGSEGAGIKQFVRPQGVAVDADGQIIVADSRNNRVQVFEANGTFKCQIGGIVDLDRPSGICITTQGKIALVDFGNNRVVLF